MFIGGEKIGSGNKCFMIAEVGQAHDGSLGMAHAYVDAISKTGVQAVKFQTHIARAESSTEERFRVKCFPQDDTRYDYWKRMEFTHEQWQGLAAHANDKGLIFLSTPFSLEAVELLESLDIPAWKIGSGDVENLPLIRKVAQTGKPVLLSTGMSSWPEVDMAVTEISKRGSQAAVFQCTTAYPCSPEEIGLNVLNEIRERYMCPVGLSDHSGTIYPGLAAASMGVSLLETHVVLSRDCFGPDVSASLTIDEVSQLVEGVRYTERMLAAPTDKDKLSNGMKELKVLFGRSIHAKNKLDKGHVLALDDLTFKKPGTGILGKDIDRILGKAVMRKYDQNEQLQEEDLYEPKDS